jgi:endonuclease/exonuclease/phosphatase family metal-dependent hydrolase
MPKAENQFTIFNLNLWLLPLGVSVSNSARLARFLNYIEKLQPDIITLQEVWLQHDVKKITGTLAGYQAFYQTGTVFNKSGLLTLISKDISVLSSHFQAFESSSKYNPAERIASKGTLKAFALFGDKRLSIINTHLYSPKRADGVEFTKQQFLKLKAMVDDDTTIIAGDLNLNSKEFTGLNQGFFQHDFSLNTVDKRNTFQSKRLNRFSKQEHKSDYILFKSAQYELQLGVKLVTSPVFSDHYPLLGKFSLR